MSILSLALALWTPILAVEFDAVESQQHYPFQDLTERSAKYPVAQNKSEDSSPTEGAMHPRPIEFTPAQSRKLLNSIKRGDIATVLEITKKQPKAINARYPSSFVEKSIASVKDIFASNVSSGDVETFTPLQVAIAYDKPEVVRHLLQNGAKFIWEASLSQHVCEKSELQAAAGLGSVEIVELLIQYGANIEHVASDDCGEANETALSIAVRHNHPNVLRKILLASEKNNSLSAYSIDRALQIAQDQHIHESQSEIRTRLEEIIRLLQKAKGRVHNVQE